MSAADWVMACALLLSGAALNLLIKRLGWHTKRIDALEWEVESLRVEVRGLEATDKSRVEFIEGLQRKNTELTTRLDEARRFAKSETTEGEQ